MLQAFFEGARQLVFPDNCLLCRRFLDSRHQERLCAGCLGSLKPNPMPFSRQNSNGLFAFDHAWSACVYNETAQNVLHAFKYNGKTALVKTMALHMIGFLERHCIPVQNFDLMAPVPLHASRLRERGYNQSAFLSRFLSVHYGMPHHETLLVRGKPTSTQTELGAKQRWTNLEGAFRIPHPTEVKDKIILLVDDLFTTGATLHHAALALKEAGAARVGALTFSVTV